MAVDHQVVILIYLTRQVDLYLLVILEVTFCLGKGIRKYTEKTFYSNSNSLNLIQPDRRHVGYLKLKFKWKNKKYLRAFFQLLPTAQVATC